jgi:hypothetical protein
LPSVFASIYNLNTGWRKMTEATAGAQAWGTISRVSWWADDGSGRGIRPRLILYRRVSWMCFDNLFGGSSLYDHCKAFASFYWINNINQGHMYIFDGEVRVIPHFKKTRTLCPKNTNNTPPSR